MSRQSATRRRPFANRELLDSILRAAPARCHGRSLSCITTSTSLCPRWPRRSGSRSGPRSRRLNRALKPDAIAIFADARTRALADRRRAVGMTAFERFERRDPDRSSTSSPRPGFPTTLDDMLRQTGRTRQRPAWASLERWLPMDVIARPAPFRAPVLRPLLILILIGLLDRGGAGAVRRLAADPPAGAVRASPQRLHVLRRYRRRYLFVRPGH